MQKPAGFIYPLALGNPESPGLTNCCHPEIPQCLPVVKGQGFWTQQQLAVMVCWRNFRTSGGTAHHNCAFVHFPVHLGPQSRCNSFRTGCRTVMLMGRLYNPRVLLLTKGNANLWSPESNSRTYPPTIQVVLKM